MFSLGTYKQHVPNSVTPVPCSPYIGLHIRICPLGRPVCRLGAVVDDEPSVRRIDRDASGPPHHCLVVSAGEVAEVPVDELAADLGLGDVNQVLSTC